MLYGPDGGFIRSEREFRQALLYWTQRANRGVGSVWVDNVDTWYDDEAEDTPVTRP